MSYMPRKNAEKPISGSGSAKTTSVTVFHVGPQDQDLLALADILNRTDWQMCPGTRWTLAASDDVPSAAARLKSENAPIVLCERDGVAGNWKDVLESVGKFAAPPMLIVASRTADEYLWAEALNLGAYDVLAKPYHPAEVVRVLSMAWLHWMNRRTDTATMAQAS
jgi:DNA-binding NtrC family response regulator